MVLHFTETYSRYQALNDLFNSVDKEFGDPVLIKDGLYLNNIIWDGRRLSHIYEANSVKLVPHLDEVRMETCGGYTRIKALSLGATLSYSYIVDSDFVADYDVVFWNCFAFGK